MRIIKTICGIFFGIIAVGCALILMDDFDGYVLFITALFAWLTYLMFKTPKEQRQKVQQADTSTIKKKILAADKDGYNYDIEHDLGYTTYIKYTPQAEPNYIDPSALDLKTLKANYKRVLEQKQHLEKVVAKAENHLEDLKSQIVETQEVVLLQSFGLYEPHYTFMKAEHYKTRLLLIREKQKEMIKNNTATTALDQWKVNGSYKIGSQMVADTRKLLTRAFNSECDDVIDHVKYNNIEASEKRITMSRDAISKLGRMMNIRITQEYYDLKLEELHLAFEWQQKKQQEKEEQREARAELKEAAKLAKEIEAARKKLEKEQNHYQNALAKIERQLEQTGEADREAIEEKKAQIVAQLDKIDAEFKEVDYREANHRAGYVYIISNIGAFGENVYKIGMTRRLEPMDRVDELGDASVPFKFDVHAMIFSDDAPALETALHNAFADRKLNYVNQRREFFNVTLDEIKAVVRENFDKSVEFVDVPPAEQYRESLLMRKEVGADF